MDLLELLIFGSGGTPAISVSPSTWNFGSTPVGTPVTKQFTIQNTGTAALEITLPITMTGDDPTAFTVTVQPTETSPGIVTLAPGASTTFTIQADAESVDSFAADISIVSNAASSPTVIPVTATILWMPSELANKVFWFGGQYAPTITKDGSNRVSLWTTKFSGGNNLAQSGADSIKPVHSPSTLGITFDGVDDFMAFVSAITQANYHIFMVCNLGAKSTTTLFAKIADSTPFIRIVDSTTFDYRDNASVLDTVTFTASALPTATDLLMEFSYEAALRNLLVNGASIGSDSTAGLGNLGFDVLGKRVAGGFASITIYEMIAVSAVLADKSDLYAYFEREWAFLSLP